VKPNLHPTLKAAIALIALVGFLCPASNAGADEELQVGHVLGLRSPEMTKEYRIALELMMERVFSEFGVDISMKSFETPEDSLTAFWSGNIDVTEISALDFALLPEDKRALMEVVGVVNLTETKFKRYQLLAAPGTSIESLKGQPIHVIGNGEWNVGRRWLELELLERFGMTSEDYFGEITVVDYENPNEAVLPVFFGKSKACLVMDYQLDLLKELNPQIGKRLAPIESSPEILGVLFAIRADYGKQKIENLKRTTERLHTTPDGQQAFTLMKVERMSAFESGDLKNMEDIARRLQNLDQTMIATLPGGVGNEGDDE